MEYYSTIKRNETVPFAETWMDLETVIQSEVNQTMKDKYCIISIMWNLKKGYKWAYKTETDLQTSKTHLSLPKKKGGRDKLAGWD